MAWRLILLQVMHTMNNFHKLWNFYKKYVKTDFQNKTVHIVESFLGFIQITQKNAVGLDGVMLSQLEKDDIKLNVYIKLVSVLY